jgi:hypothetical protein
MDYEQMDKLIRHYKADKQEAARALGYGHVSEAAIDLYGQDLSSEAVGKALGVTAQCVRYWFEHWGIARRPKGGDMWRINRGRAA